MLKRLFWVGVGAILLVCGVFVDAVEEKRSHTSEEGVDAQAKLREIVDIEYRTSTSTKASSASQDYDLANELIDMRLLKKGKKAKKGSKKGKIKRAGKKLVTPTGARPLTSPGISRVPGTARVKVLYSKGSNKANVRA